MLELLHALFSNLHRVPVGSVGGLHERMQHNDHIRKLGHIDASECRAAVDDEFYRTRADRLRQRLDRPIRVLAILDATQILAEVVLNIQWQVLVSRSAAALTNANFLNVLPTKEIRKQGTAGCRRVGNLSQLLADNSDRAISGCSLMYPVFTRALQELICLLPT